MDVSQFEFLVEKVTPKIVRKDTFMRNSITPQEMVCVALRYLASGESFRSLQFQFRLGRRTISECVMDVCAAIFEVLGVEYLQTPKNEQEWTKIARKFELRWNFPNGIGAVDGKHI